MTIALLLLLGGWALSVLAGLSEPTLASYYAHRFHGRTTASGARFNMHALTAAHRTLPFGTRVLVTNLLNQRKVLVTITDRGPFIKGRIIDLSRRAAQLLGCIERGVVPVKLEVKQKGS